MHGQEKGKKLYSSHHKARIGGKRRVLSGSEIGRCLIPDGTQNKENSRNKNAKVLVILVFHFRKQCFASIFCVPFFIFLIGY
mgnify:CR=1 FL=1